MSNVRPSKDGAPRGRQPQRRPGNEMFRDPVVRRMTYVAIGLVILFLATVVGALFTGVIARSDNVDTAAERDLLIAKNSALAPGATGESWAPYIDALTASGDLRQAQLTLEHAKSSLPATVTVVPGLDLSEARLLRAQERYEAAVDAARSAMDGYDAAQQARLDKGGTVAETAREIGVDYRYYEAALVAAYSYVELSRWEEAVEMFDIYLAHETSAADIFVDRGNAKAELKDNAGAEADFRQALRFVPYDEGAKAGLEKIGAAK